MELRHLRYFVAVAEERHVTRAAARLGIQQPPLSQQIRALEAELEVQLFRRKPRGVELTDAGRAFFEDARAILARVDQAEAKAQRTARGELGTIAVGFTMSASLNPFVPTVIREFQETYPRVSLLLDDNSSSELVNAVVQERMDVAFIRSEILDTEGVTAEIVLDEPMIAAVPAGHRFARSQPHGTATPLPLSAFAGERLILYRRRIGPGLYDAIYNTIVGACQRAGFSPNITQNAPQIVSSLNLVSAGLGVSIVPQSVRHFMMPGVVFIGLEPQSGLVAPIYLASRTSGHSATVRNFVQMVRKSARHDTAAVE